MATRIARVDSLGRACAGSQLQVQIYVNRRPEELSQAILEGLPSLASLGLCPLWVSPLENQRFVECQDRRFLNALRVGHLSSQLSGFWPRRGPVWDALAAIVIPKSDQCVPGVLLVEAKSHPAEVYGPGCGASSPKSRRMIEAALNEARQWLSVRQDRTWPFWTGPLYQSANRLAHLYFFNEIAKVPAWLVNVYFLNDPHSPTTLMEWKAALDCVKMQLGLGTHTAQHMAEVFLEAKSRDELV